MKNLFLEKNIVQKLIIALVIIVLFNFASPTICNAKSSILDKGGALLSPILEIIVFIADSVLDLLQKNLLADVDILVSAEAKSEADVASGFAKLGWAAGIILIGASIIAIPFTLGASVTVASLATATMIGGTAVVLAGINVSQAITSFTGEFDIPQLAYTPFAIFSNKVPMFDINFFEPNTINTEVVTVKERLEEYQVEDMSTGWIFDESTEFHHLLAYANRVSTWSCRTIFNYDGVDFKVENLKSEKGKFKGDVESKEELDAAARSIAIMGKWLEYGFILPNNSVFEDWCEEADINPISDKKETLWLALIAKGMDAVPQISTEETPDAIDLENYPGSFHVNSVNDVIGDLKNGTNYHVITCVNSNYIGKTYEQILEESGYTEDKLREDIQTLYNYTLKIKGEAKVNAEQEITANEKNYSEDTPAKKLHGTIAYWYKTLRAIALVALLVILIYIGIRIVISSTAPEKAKYKQMIMNWFAALCILVMLHLIMVLVINVTQIITEALSTNCTELIVVPLPDGLKEVDGMKFEQISDDDPTPPLATNFVGYVRYLAGIYSPNEFGMQGVGYFVMYIMLVVQTCMFTWVYAKRVVYMAFLTIIAPLVAITYPIDKIGDGKSQAFDMWLKEYIFNALLQPVHLLMYTVLCGCAMELMTSTPIYGIVALAFVVPAEKFIRKMFGFEKAQTPSALGGAAGAALAMSGIQRLGNLIRPDGKDDRDADKPSKMERIRTASTDSQEKLKKDAEAGKNKAKGIRTANENNQQAGSDGENSLSQGREIPPIASGDDTASADAGGQPIDIEDNETPADEGNTPVDPNGQPLDIGDGESATDEGNSSVDESGQPLDVGDGEADDEAGQPIDEVDSELADDEGNTSVDGGKQSIDVGDKLPANEENLYADNGENDSNSKAKKPSRFKRAMGAVFDLEVERFRQANTARKWTRRGRRVIRGATGAALGASAGLTMAAMKLAMGSNAGDVITTATAGTAAGYAIGSKGAQKAQEFAKMDDARERFADGWHTPEENKKIKDEKARKKEKRDYENRMILQEAAPDNWKELLNGKNGEQGWVDYCYDYGLTDMQQIAAAYKNRNSEEFKNKFDKNGVSSEQLDAIALTIAKNHTKHGSLLADPKKELDLENGLINQYMQDENIQNMTLAELEEKKQADYIRETAKLDSDIQNDKALNDAQTAILEAEEEEQKIANEANEQLQKLENENLAAEVAKNSLQRQLQETQARYQYLNSNAAISDIEKEYDSRILKEREYINSNPNLSSKIKQESEDRIKALQDAKDDRIKQLKRQKKNIEKQQRDIEDSINKLKTSQAKEVIEQEKVKVKQGLEKQQRAISKKKDKATAVIKQREKEFDKRRKNLEDARKQPVKMDNEALKENAKKAAKEYISDIKIHDDMLDSIKG